MTPTTRSFSEVRQALLRATSLSQLNKSAQEIQQVGIMSGMIQQDIDISLTPVEEQQQEELAEAA